jgi:hypothetical protein
VNKYIKIAFGAFVGAVLGYSYYYFIGCNSGGCPITSNWHISTLYGAAMGVLLAIPSRKKDKGNEKEETKYK